MNQQLGKIEAKEVTPQDIMDVLHEIEETNKRLKQLEIKVAYFENDMRLREEVSSCI